MKKYLIVGGVAGGAGTAARLRRLDETAQITIFERGKHISFANCGLPYYVGGTIADRSALFVTNEQRFNEVFNVEVKTLHEVTSIDKERQSIVVKDLTADTEREYFYDTLILSPGAAPLRPPISGIDDKDIYILRNVKDVDAIVKKVECEQTKRAVVVGGGFIGLEMAENLTNRGLQVTLVEALEQVMNVIDYDMATLVQQHMRHKGVTLYLKDGVKAFERRGDELFVLLNSETVIPTDLVILSIGVRPDTKIAQDANLTLGSNGAIRVDEYFTTSDPHIKAVGDAIEYLHPITKLPVTVPLAGPANKQARLCADSIVGIKREPYKGIIATSIAQIFDLTAATTGMSSKQLKQANIPFKEIITHSGCHAGYYPKSLQITLKVLYDPKTGRLYGGQAVGYKGVDKRIDVLAAYIAKEGSVDDLAEFEQAYAPPFSSAKDPLNMVGFIAQNVKDNLTSLLSVEKVPQFIEEGALLVDVRKEEEFLQGHIETSINIPHRKIRENLHLLSKERVLILYCTVGIRGYIAERILRQHGFTKIYNLTGGYNTYLTVKQEQDALKYGSSNTVAPFEQECTDSPLA